MRRLSILFALFAPLAAAGCAGFLAPDYAQLPPAKVSKLDVGLAAGGNQFCVDGPEAQLRAGVQLTDGTTNVTWAYGPGGVAQKDGRLDFADFTWRASAGIVTSDGLYQPPTDPIPGLDRPVTIDATVNGRPDLHQQIQLAPRYDCGQIVEHDGVAGAAGAPGWDGASGSDGIDGGSGSDGEDGGNGGPGSAGTAGPLVNVSLGYIDGAAGRRVLAKVETGDAIDYAILDAHGPALQIIARGGAGGAGGAGGSGGRGGSGSTSDDGKTTGTDGRDGQSGWAGDGGAGGRGGTVRVFFDARYPELESMVSIDNRGGRGGDGRTRGASGSAGPAPVFAPVDAAALFPGEIAHGVAIATQGS